MASYVDLQIENIGDTTSIDVDDTNRYKKKTTVT
jgi:hypothetical protein